MNEKTKSEAVEPIEKFLKRIRKSKGLSLDDVARDTRVRKIYLKQFETKVPQDLDVYKIGYLRLYARHLDVDIQQYINARNNNNSTQQTNSTNKKYPGFIRVIKQKFQISKAILVVGTISIALISLAVLEWKKRSSEVVAKPSSQQDVNVTTEKPEADAYVKQTDSYTHLLTNYSGKVKVVARIATVFTLLDPATNKQIAKGTIKAGEELSLPDMEVIIIRTTLPDALDIQQEVTALNVEGATK